MQLVKLTTLRVTGFLLFFAVAIFSATAQDNSPYSRYGLGDLVPATNINSRGMAGISAGVNDFLSLNFSNPATYGSFETAPQRNSKKIAYGRSILDIGITIDNRTMREPNTINKFTAKNAVFSHVQFGTPLRKGWGIGFGLRPYSRVSYKISQVKYTSIDSLVSLYQGTGGAYLVNASIGKRITINKTSFISIGVTPGYLFGRKDYSTRVGFINDTVSYTGGNYETNTNYGGLYFDAGIQYISKVGKDMYLTLGAYGNNKRTLNARQDIIRETYFYDAGTGNIRIDSVQEKKDIKGKVIHPGSYTAGFVFEKLLTEKSPGWLFGMDYTTTKWDNYRFYGQKETTLKNNWSLKLGAQLRPVPKDGYFSNVAYRLGITTGPDYVYVNKKLPVTGVTFGMGLPLASGSRLYGDLQSSVINLSLEYLKRGNNSNLLKENMFRISAGFSLTDLWYRKKKYD